MRVLIAGGSGYVGRALVPALRAGGHEVRLLVRRVSREPFECEWHPETGSIAARDVDWADCIVNLSGKNISDGRWTAQRCRDLRQSRLDATDTIVTALCSGEMPARKTLINASAVGYYGDCGDSVVCEDAPPGTGFLSGLCRDWETRALSATQAGVRVVCLRLGVVIGEGGGLLSRMLPIFRVGLGGRLGDGRAWMSWIGVDDLVRVMLRSIEDQELSGAVNAVSPFPVRNSEFTEALADSIHRRAGFGVPAFMLRAVFGQMADEVLLASIRVTPRVLIQAGFKFQTSSIPEALVAKHSS